MFYDLLRGITPYIQQRNTHCNPIWVIQRPAVALWITIQILPKGNSPHLLSDWSDFTHYWKSACCVLDMFNRNNQQNRNVFVYSLYGEYFMLNIFIFCRHFYRFFVVQLTLLHLFLLKVRMKFFMETIDPSFIFVLCLQLRYIIDTQGQLPSDLLKLAQRTKYFFNWDLETSQWKLKVCTHHLCSPCSSFSVYF